MPQLAEWQKYRRRTGICKTCSQVMKTHLKCKICGVLIGCPGHAALRIYDGKCAVCAGHRTRYEHNGGTHSYILRAPDSVKRGIDSFDSSLATMI